MTTMELIDYPILQNVFHPSDFSRRERNGVCACIEGLADCQGGADYPSCLAATGGGVDGVSGST